ncbi:MAG: polysaccharide biosynthesis/export family protein [Fimbriimonadaceae bacterium]
MRAVIFSLLAMISCNAYPQAKAVKISVDDRLSVTVVGFKEYTGLYDVASDGTISGAGFGIAAVAGKTIAQVTELLTSKFRLVILDPHVYVGLAVERPKVIYLVGLPAPENPPVLARSSGPKLPLGAVAFLPETTVRSLLAGGSFGDRPDRFEGLVVRGGQTVARFDIDKLLGGDSTQFDGPLKPNDVVIIRSKPRVKIWLMGPFRQPGDHMVPAGITVDEAISAAGGIDVTWLPPGSDFGGAAALGRAHIEFTRGGVSRSLPALAGSPDLALTVEAGDTFTLVLPKTLNVTVAGFVARPSEVSIDASVGAMAAIAKAGGPAPSGGLSNVLLYRGSEMYHLDLTPGSAMPPQMPLHPNDLIYIGENRRSVQVLGAVQKAGILYLPDDKRELRASEALVRVNGLAGDGSLRRAVLVRRGADGKYFVFKKFNLDEFLKDGKIAANPVLEPGDVLYFGTPKGLSSQGIIQLISAAAVLYSVGFRL